MNADEQHKENLLLFASVILPILHENEEVLERFWEDFQDYFLELEGDVQEQLKLLIKAISAMSFLYNFKSFRKLDFQQREKYIKKLFNFPIPLFVGGLTGLRSLCFFAFYTNESEWKKIKYNGPRK